LVKINHLIIIGGPSASGKSFLMEKTQHGNCPRLCEQIGMTDPCSWLYIHVNKLKHIDQTNIERLVIHYDFFSQYSKPDGFNYLYDLIRNSDKIVVLTLCVSTKTLVRRNALRLLQQSKTLLFPKNHRKKIRRFVKLWKKQKLYKNDFSVSLYGKWFKFWNEYNLTGHWLLNFNKSGDIKVQPYKTDKMSDLNI